MYICTKQMRAVEEIAEILLPLLGHWSESGQNYLLGEDPA